MKKNKLYLILTLIFSLNSFSFGSQVWKSMVLPGWGEKKINYHKRGNALMFTEYGLWVSYIFCVNQSSSYRNDYKNHGEHYAGVDWSNKNDLYAANVGNYNSLQEYNEIKARDFLEEDMYPTNGDYDWDWESRKERLKYDTWRNKSKNYGEVKGFLVAGMLLNRLISVIDVVILERKNKLTSELTKNNHSMSFNIHYNF
tara:strand:- start:95 stop:691 length:597 start_codon:yes stop_codon:yes gene_type:complete